jgi:hypothetical protein
MRPNWKNETALMPLLSQKLTVSLKMRSNPSKQVFSIIDLAKSAPRTIKFEFKIII